MKFRGYTLWCTNMAGWKMNLLKMYSLLKTGDFSASYASLQEGTIFWKKTKKNFTGVLPPLPETKHVCFSSVYQTFQTKRTQSMIVKRGNLFLKGVRLRLRDRNHEVSQGKSSELQEIYFV